MSATLLDPGPEATPAAPVVSRSARRVRAEHLALGGIVLVAFVLNAWALSENGLGNTYYAAAVRSMNESWSNFFYGAFDPGGFITVDKPPVSLWIEATSARIFGYSSWSLLLPGAVAGAASVAVLFVTVRRHFGPVAGGVAALALAVSPVNVAVNRLNLPEPFMILFLVLAAWAVTRSFDEERWVRWLVTAGAFVGLAFNTKMLAAAVPVPALALAILVATRGGVWPRLRRVAVFGLAALAFSLPWLAVVELVPESSRPYIGGSTDNSVVDLVFGYNGLDRVSGDGQLGGGGAPAGGGGATPGGGGLGAAGGVFGGAAGSDRLFSEAVGGQIAWLVPLAAFGVVVAAWRHRRNAIALAGVVLWTGWALFHAGVFSSAEGIFHSYYTAALAPGIAALVGIGAVAIWHQLRASRLRWLWAAGLGGALAVTVWLQLVVAGRAGDYYGWARQVVVVGAIAAFGGVIVALLVRARRVVLPGALAVALAAVLVIPTGWAVSEAANPSLNSTLPQAGPRSGSSATTFGSDGFEGNQELAAWLAARNDEGVRWDLAVSSAMSASELVADSELSVMALGGFTGSDPAATVESIADAVEAGEVRYFLVGGGFPGGGTLPGLPGGGQPPGLPGGGPLPDGGPGGLPNGFPGGLPGGLDPDDPDGSGTGGGPAAGFRPPSGIGGAFGRGTATEILAAVEEACTPVGDTAPAGYESTLYDCAGGASALAALA